MQIWPPKNVKDSGSRLHSKLKEAIMQVRPVIGALLKSHLFSIFLIPLLQVNWVWLLESGAVSLNIYSQVKAFYSNIGNKLM